VCARREGRPGPLRTLPDRLPALSVPEREDLVTTVGEAEAVVPTPREMPGVHAGAIIFLGIAAANLGNYAFHLISARVLGPEGYGEVASLIALAGLIALPLGGIQILVARAVATGAAEHRSLEIKAFARRMLLMTTAGGVLLTIALVLVSPLLARVLDIDSMLAVVLTAAIAAPSVLTPALWGLAQGLQRFAALATAMALTPTFRVVGVIVFLAAGFGVAGAIGATLVAALLGVAVPAWALRDWLKGPRERGVSGTLLPSPVREFAPVAIGLLALTSLTTIDVVIAKAVLDEDTAGMYASASLVGRVILYLPAAVVTVLLPKVSARVAVGEDAGRILAASIGVTTALCVAATLVYVLAAPFIAEVTLGSDFEDVAELLPLFAVAMTGYAVLNVLLAYHLGRGSARMSYLLLIGAVVQLVGFAFFHDSSRELVAVSIVLAGLLLVAHEVLIEPSLTRATRRLGGLARSFR
jgi:O-antigen/teichoic acid export membrane protein